MNFIKKYKSQTEASKETGIKQSEISKCCNGLRNKAGDYIWCYDDRLLSELETYKKIAEKLAEELAGNDDYMQNIIDWARSEVDNEKNIAKN